MAFTEEWLQQHNAKMAAQRVAGAGVRVLDRPVDAASSAQPAVAVGNTGSQQGRGALSPDTTNGGVVATGLSGSACGARVKAVGVTPAVARAMPQAGERPATNCKQRPEEVLQIAVAELLDLGLPQGWRWWHTPNQRGTRKYWEQKLLKALGVKAGIQDVTIVGPDPRLVIIELKSDTGSLSKSQREWRDFYRSIGVPWFLARTIDDVIAACQDAGVPLRVRAS